MGSNPDRVTKDETVTQAETVWVKTKQVSCVLVGSLDMAVYGYIKKALSLYYDKGHVFF